MFINNKREAADGGRGAKWEMQKVFKLSFLWGCASVGRRNIMRILISQRNVLQRGHPSEEMRDCEEIETAKNRGTSLCCHCDALLHV